MLHGSEVTPSTTGATARGGEHSPKIAVPRGKALGGSSAVNAGVAIRLRPDDVEKWGDHGLPGWSYPEVLATLRAMENNPDGEDSQHGRSGPFPIRQLSREGLSTSLRAFIDAAKTRGHARVEDFNGTSVRGVTGTAVNIIDGVRENTGIIYLSDEVRARPNLTIRGDVTVDRVLFAGGAATGVVGVDGEVILAREVVLSSGAYGSPAILLRSGVGPAHDLAALGIDVVADLPVGQRLQDHPAFYNAYALATDALDMQPVNGALLWTASGEAVGEELDVHVSATHLIDPAYSPTGGAVVLLVALTQPDSRGTLTLSSSDPSVPPEIDNNFLAEPRDRRRMFEAVRGTRRLGRSPAFAAVTAAEMLPGDAVDDDALDAAVEAALNSYSHPTSTAPMGTHDDPWAVVDVLGAVRGVTGLRVVDASILPRVPSTATNVTTIMVAEHIARRAYAASDGATSNGHVPASSRTAAGATVAAGSALTDDTSQPSDVRARDAVKRSKAG